MTGRVVGSDGEPVRDAVVKAYLADMPHRGRFEATTGRDGRFRVEVDAEEIRIPSIYEGSFERAVADIGWELCIEGLTGERTCVWPTSRSMGAIGLGELLLWDGWDVTTEADGQDLFVRWQPPASSAESSTWVNFEQDVQRITGLSPVTAWSKSAADDAEMRWGPWELSDYAGGMRVYTAVDAPSERIDTALHASALVEEAGESQPVSLSRGAACSDDDGALASCPLTDGSMQLTLGYDCDETCEGRTQTVIIDLGEERAVDEILVRGITEIVYEPLVVRFEIGDASADTWSLAGELRVEPDSGLPGYARIRPESAIAGQHVRVSWRWVGVHVWTALFIDEIDVFGLEEP